MHMGRAVLSVKVLRLQVTQYQLTVASALDVQDVVHSPAALASSGSLVEVQHLRLDRRRLEPESVSSGSLGGSRAC